MASNESGNLWFLQPGAANPNTQTSPPPAPQQTYQSQNPNNPFNQGTQSSPPQDGSSYSSPHPGFSQQQHPPPQGPSYPPPPYVQDSPYPLKQESPYPPKQESPYPQQQGSPYPQQQGSPYPQEQGGPFQPSQPGTPYSQQQGSPYPRPVYPPPQQQSPYPPPQQNIYAQPGQYTSQQGYPQQQGSPYPQQGYPQQGYGQPQQREFSDPNSQVSGEAASFYGAGPSQLGQPGPGPGGPGDRGFFDSAIQFAGVQQPPPGPDGLERGWFSSSRNPLDPPPKMFKRHAPGHYAYINFRPLSVLAVSDRLQDGFALLPPVTTPGETHPFISHDITEEDWHKFLKDFQKTAHLSASDRLFQGISNSFMKGKIPSAKVQKRMAENKLEPIGDYLMAWNHYFFRPRRITVILARGRERFSGESDDYPPDVVGHSNGGKSSHHKTRSAGLPLVTAAEPYPRGSLIGGLLNPIHKAIHETTMTVATAPTDLLYGTKRGVYPTERSHHGTDDSYSSSSDSDDFRSHHRGKIADRRADREHRRGERRARKIERRGRKHGKVAESVFAVDVPSGRFRLVLCYWDGQREVY